MYTVIYNRERHADVHDGIMHIESFSTEKEVRDFIRFKTFDQERLESEAYRFRGDRYVYGDYGFIVLKNGELLYERNIYNTCDECIIPPLSDNPMDCFQDQMAGVEQNSRLQFQIEELVKSEKDYATALSVHKEVLKKAEEIAKEKALLKSLLEKYPDMNP